MGSYWSARTEDGLDPLPPAILRSCEKIRKFSQNDLQYTKDYYRLRRLFCSRGRCFNALDNTDELFDFARQGLEERDRSGTSALQRELQPHGPLRLTGTKYWVTAFTDFSGRRTAVEDAGVMRCDEEAWQLSRSGTETAAFCHFLDQCALSASLSPFRERCNRLLGISLGDDSAASSSHLTALPVFSIKEVQERPAAQRMVDTGKVISTSQTSAEFHTPVDFNRFRADVARASGSPSPTGNPEHPRFMVNFGLMAKPWVPSPPQRVESGDA